MERPGVIRPAAKDSTGDRIADAVARFGGSWAFIGLFLGSMSVWIATNIWLLRRPFDPFPFILLNLLLSCVAAIQAPVIMMSQNRQEAKDRARAEKDLQINIKAEHEIKTLHEKLERLQASITEHHQAMTRLLASLETRDR